MGYFRIFAKDLAIDLGTANVLVYMANKGIILNEPSVVAIDIKTGEVIAFGQEAYKMMGKTPENIAVVKPLENGVVSDFDITKILLEYVINKALPGVSLMQPRVLITAPAGISDVELRAIEDACIHSGVREVYIVEGSLASAIGAGMNIDQPDGHMIISLGAGNTEVAIVSLNGIVLSESSKYGGDYFNMKIMNKVRDKYSVSIGELTAEKLKKTIGSVGNLDHNDMMEVSGRDLLTGMPSSVFVYSSDIKEAIIEEVEYIIDMARYLLEKNPPELSADIIKNGIYLTGGQSLIKGLDKLIEEELGIKTVNSPNPFEDTVMGAGKMIENLNKYKNYGK